MRSSDRAIATDNEDPSPVTVPNKQDSDELRLTILDESGLPQRLVNELRFACSQSRNAWLTFKTDPRAFLAREVVKFSENVRVHVTPKVIASCISGIGLVGLAALILAIASSPSEGEALHKETLPPFQVVMLTPPRNDVSTLKASIGYQGHGRVGFNSGAGEGSNTKTVKSQGGGGGGELDQKPTQQGAVPQPSEIQARIPNTPPTHVQSLPRAGVDIDPVLWKDLPFPVYGDPRSRSALTSNGPGRDGGMGDGRGTGVGEGDGPGIGPGQDGNIGGNRRSRGSLASGGGSDCSTAGCGGTAFTVRQVHQRARLLSKPEPQYTEEARRNQVMGTVILRVVFASSGEVTNIQAVKTLPFGLTERAIMAARRIRFVPAMKDGQPVSVHMQLEYNFNLY